MFFSPIHRTKRGLDWLLLRQRERLVLSRRGRRNELPVPGGVVAGSRHQSSRLPAWERRLSRSLFSLSCILLCAVRNDLIPPRSPSPVAVPDCSPLYGGTLWLVHTFSPPPNHTHRLSRGAMRLSFSLFSWWASMVSSSRWGIAGNSFYASLVFGGPVD
jgi:hypothetical protein